MAEQFVPEAAAGGFNVCLFNGDDPRGGKIGGTSTYVRDFITHHPGDMNLLLVAPDEVGDLEVGRVNRVEFRGREIGFFAVYRSSTAYDLYPTGILNSETFRYGVGVARRWRDIRRLLRRGRYTAEVRRVEIAPIVWSLGVRFIQMVHVWGRKDQPMSSILARHTLLRGALEGFSAATASRFYSVNSDMTAMYRRKFPWSARKMDTLTTWADPDRYQCAPFDLSDGVLRLAYVGRADRFKRLDVLFQVVAEVARQVGRVEFHYAGDGRLSEVPGYEQIRPFLVDHGVCKPAELAAIWRSVHIGLLTSEFEGMPRAVLEALSCGRPVAALHLPQLEAVIVEGVSGCLVPRSDDQVERLAQGVLSVREAILAGRIDPRTVADQMAAFRPEPLLGRVYAEHRRLQQAAQRGAA